MVDDVLKRHKNKTNAWKYEGKFTVQVAREADLSVVVNLTGVTIPPGTDARGFKVLTVEDGKVTFHPAGGLQFYSSGSPFRWRERHIRVVWKEDGSPLWVNHPLI